MKRRFIILAMITTMALLVFVTGGLAQPAFQINEKIDVGPISLWNPCTEELVELDGTLHLSGRLLLDSAEGFHLKLHANSHLAGEGISGTEYIANATYNWQLNGKFLPFETTKILTVSLISQGKEPNLKLKARFYVTVNANGELTAYVDEFEVECTGGKP